MENLCCVTSNLQYSTVYQVITQIQSSETYVTFVSEEQQVKRNLQPF